MPTSIGMTYNLFLYPTALHLRFDFRLRFSIVYMATQPSEYIGRLFFCSAMLAYIPYDGLSYLSGTTLTTFPSDIMWYGSI